MVPKEDLPIILYRLIMYNIILFQFTIMKKEDEQSNLKTTQSQSKNEKRKNEKEQKSHKDAFYSCSMALTIVKSFIIFFCILLDKGKRYIILILERCKSKQASIN